MRTTTINRRVLGAIVGATTLALVGIAPAVGASPKAADAADATPTQAELDAMPFRDPGLPLDDRIDDLLARMTPEEEISLLHQFPLPVPRLGIGHWRAGTEAVHGLAWTTSPEDGAVHTATATTFPQAVGLASTWDTDLLQQVGGVVGDEARGYNAQDPELWGLNLWAPVVNPLRDPRWGRNEEGYSEDPTLTSAIATSYGQGMEGDDPFYLKTAPTLKHYLAYNNETSRDTSSSVVPPRVLHEYDEQAFEPVIRADAATGVMASYNLINGRPATVDPSLDGTVRSWTDKTLFNVSDAAAPTNLTGSEQYYETQPEADAALVKAGLDTMVVNDNDPQPTITAVQEALEQGLLSQADVDDAASNQLSIRFRLGEFDPDGGPYADITADAIDTPAHRELARTTAAESQVLLKNAKKTLPLDARKTKDVAVVGPLADTLYTDWYGGTQPYSVTPLDGITERLGDGATVRTTEGVDRVTLRDAETGRYVVGGADDAGANLAATADEAGATAQFDVFDWGDGVVTLRSAANGKTVGSAGSGFANDQDQPNGWFVQQLFRIEDRPDGNVVLRYAGYDTAESWSPSHATPYLTVDGDGMLVLGAADADAATEFSRDVVTSGTQSAVKAAKKADAAVVVVGTMPFINGREAHDRSEMNLAEGQEELVEAVLAANPNTVVVLESSYPQTIDRLQKKAPAILWTTHAGQETGHAVADVLFGDVNPAGRLTQTWPTSTDDLPPDLNDYDIITSGQTYLYDRSTPLYAFGHGLSYTSFRYSDLKVADRKITAKGTIEVTVKVTNTGRRDGDEVVQLYTHQRSSRDTTAVKALRTFDRVHVKAGHTKKVTLEVPAQDLRHWDVTRDRWVVETSVYDVMVGGASDDIRQRSTVTVLGQAIPARDLSRKTQAQNFDDHHATTLVDTSKESGTSVGSTGEGSWVAYRDVDLGRGASTFTASVARADAGTGHVEVRLGSPRGRVVGTATVASTGDVYAYEKVRADLSHASGRQDVYLVFDSPMRMSTFRVTS